MSESPNPQKAKIDKKIAIDTLWRKGIVHWKLDKNQQEMLKFVNDTDEKIIVIASSRQLGKSYFLCTYALQVAMQNPNVTIKYVAPKIKDIKNVILNHIREITQDCPKELRPKYKTNDHIFYFPNGSMIQLAATENGHIDGVRGTRAHLCIVDEAGFCSDLNYAINSVLLPTTTTTNGKIIIASTPARTPDHDFVKIMNEAELDDRMIRKTIYDNPRLTEKDIQAFIDACGGKETVQFRREYLAENIISMEDAVVPEFASKELQDRIIYKYTRPSHFDAYVSMDIGGNDFTAILFAYVDFLKAKLIIDGEIVLKGKEILSDNIAYQIKQKEDKLFSNPMTGETKTPFRVSDNNNIILLNDLQVKHQLMFVPTLKDDKQAALNNMRLMLKSETIVINPECKNLINHLKSAIWNKSRKDYARASDKGHFDTIDALVYLCRNVNMNKNPYPDHFKYQGFKDIHYNEPPKSTTDFEKKLEQVFKVKRRIGRFGR